MIYIDADANLATWRLIKDAGGYEHYQGRATRDDVILRWGANGSRYQGRYPEGAKVLNPKLLLSKILQNELFQVHGVPIPTIVRHTTVWESLGRPVLISKPDQGQMGTGVELVRSAPAFISGKLFQLYIDKEREFRAMMVGDIMAFFMEKHRPENPNEIRWNEHRGSQWSSVPADDGLRRTVREIGAKALKAIGYDFGAMDIIKKGNNFYVLEVNSRPEFGQSNAERFTRAVAHYLGR